MTVKPFVVDTGLEPGHNSVDIGSANNKFRNVNASDTISATTVTASGTISGSNVSASQVTQATSIAFSIALG
jgi:hypothetical protein